LPASISRVGLVIAVCPSQILILVCSPPTFAHATVCRISWPTSAISVAGSRSLAPREVIRHVGLAIAIVRSCFPPFGVKHFELDVQ
jgi:hypothetical protein